MIEKVIIKDRVGYFQNSYTSDPLVHKIYWGALSNESSNFRKYKLKELDSSRLKFVSTFSGMFGSILFMFFALAIIVFILLLAGIPLIEVFNLESLSFENDNFQILIWVFIGMIMFLVGSLMLYFGTTPRYFDKTKELFWRGRRIPNMKKKKRVSSLKDIHALQLISKRTRTDRASSGTNFKYVSFELNLILHSGRRLHVVCHGHKESMTADALKLSGFLNKPIWDATR